MVAFAGGATAKTAGNAQCPLKPGSPSGGDVQWAFSETGPPAGSHRGISSYTHGRGNWTSGRATGKACSQDSRTTGPPDNIVLAVAGNATLSPGIMELGLPGVGLTLSVTVSGSDDPACAAGTHGTVTLLASYYSTHSDSLALHFGHACADHNHRYTGSKLHVLITRHGAQVNSA
jgi:hypothetical protein